MVYIYLVLCIVVTTASAGSPSNCTDATFINCKDSHVCSHTDLKKYCPLTCGICKPCQDESVFNCNQNVCSFPTLKKFCPVTCNSCSESSHIISTHVNGCIYKGKTYQQDDHFDDGCLYKCVCEDASTGKYVCREKCYKWNLPSVCSLDPPASGKCCHTPSCPSYVQITYPQGYSKE
ncbi:uncharacterized protein LOC134722891 [Mytilus trossulus]|uniref:uncharacterized protein LOC134722891 n=1 Tax=Mytilus trossulus TaxID=6551 RepID=UPI003003B908